MNRYRLNPVCDNVFIHNGDVFGNLLQRLYNQLRLKPDSAHFCLIYTAKSGSVSRKLARANKGE